ncbi:MAG: hypothetical protein K9J06_05605 [Flavobacteriales bacterium]|nr:hypothetical protein [Flavobacteriales bacterium]
MRATIALILLVMMATQTKAQDAVYSDTAHYDYYMLGEWDEVIAHGKLARKQGVDHYYLRARNGYAYYMKGRYMAAAAEFQKAVAFNPYSDHAQTYLLWSQQAAGMRSESFLTMRKMPISLRNHLGVQGPKFFDGIAVSGGYRISTGDTLIGSTPVVALSLSHWLGSRLMLEHGVSYMNVERFYGDAWQVAYLAQLGLQLAPRWNVKGAFTANHWGTKQVLTDGTTTDSTYTEYGGALSLQWRTRRISLSGYGGYLQGGGAANDSLVNTTGAQGEVLEQFFGGMTFGWYPLANLDLYSFTSVHYAHFLTRTAEISARQTIGGRIAKGTWLTATYTWNRPMFNMMGHQATFADNALEPLDHSASLQALYSPKGRWGISLTYSFEARRIRLPNEVDSPIGATPQNASFNYHGLFAGFQLKF